MELSRRPVVATLVSLLLVLGACSSDDADSATDGVPTDEERDAIEDPTPDDGSTSPAADPSDPTGAGPADEATTDPADGAGDPVDTGTCSPARPGTTDAGRSFDGGTGERPFRLAVPADYDGTVAAPVILDLHGLQSNADQEAGLTGFETEATALGYVVVSPNGAQASATGTAAGTGQFWDITMEGNTDVAYLEALLDELEGELCLDPTSYFATGMSNGGGMSAVLACLSDRFAAVVPVAGVNINSGCRPDGAVPVVAIHGDADIIVRYDADITVPEAMAEYAAAAACDPEPAVELLFEDVERRTWTGCDAQIELYTVLGGGHTWPGRDLVGLAGDEQIAEIAEGRGMDPEQLRAILGHMSTNIDASALALETFEAHRSDPGAPRP